MLKRHTFDIIFMQSVIETVEVPDLHLGLSVSVRDYIFPFLVVETSRQKLVFRISLDGESIYQLGRALILS